MSPLTNAVCASGSSQPIAAFGVQALLVEGRCSSRSPSAACGEFSADFHVSPSCVAICPPACQIVGRYMCSLRPVKPIG